ncbi:MAG: dihydrodipicolinate synthase family protein, partial [Flavobacteriales bacterium]
AAMNSKMDEAREAHYKLFEMFGLLFAEGNPGGIKELLSHMGICENTLRLPLENVSEDLSEEIRKLK